MNEYVHVDGSDGPGPAGPAHPRRPCPGREPEVVRGDRSGLPPAGHRADVRYRQGPVRGPGPDLRRCLPPRSGSRRTGRCRRDGPGTGGIGGKLAPRTTVPRRRMDQLHHLRQPVHRQPRGLRGSGHQLDGPGHPGSVGPGRPRVHGRRQGGHLHHAARRTATAAGATSPTPPTLRAPRTRTRRHWSSRPSWRSASPRRPSSSTGARPTPSRPCSRSS